MCNWRRAVISSIRYLSLNRFGPEEKNRIDDLFLSPAQRLSAALTPADGARGRKAVQPSKALKLLRPISLAPDRANFYDQFSVAFMHFCIGRSMVSSQNHGDDRLWCRVRRFLGPAIIGGAPLSMAHQTAHLACGQTYRLASRLRPCTQATCPRTIGKGLPSSSGLWSGTHPREPGRHRHRSCAVCQRLSVKQDFRAPVPARTHPKFQPTVRVEPAPEVRRRPIPAGFASVREATRR